MSMKKAIRSLKNYSGVLYNQDVFIQKRILYFTNVIGLFASVFGAFLPFISPEPSANYSGVIGLIGMLFIFYESLVVSDRNVELVCELLCIFFNIFEFPLIFINTGGVSSGAAIYLVEGMILCAVLLSGKKRFIFVFLSFLWQAGLIVGTTYYPEFIVQRPEGAFPFILISGLFLVGGCSALQLSLVLNNLDRLNEQLIQKATVDELTKVYNRQYLVEKINDMKAKKQLNEEVFMIMFDIDDFKQINDRYGHLVGNQVLHKMGEILLREGNRYTIPVRYGGEEFIMLMTRSTRSQVVETAERIRYSFQQLNDEFDFLGGLSLSAGLGQYERDKDLDAWMQGVDDCLYRAKEEGKNRVCC